MLNLDRRAVRAVHIERVGRRRRIRVEYRQGPAP
ncbi:hypothetical protein BH23ACT5_BH23ACT5_21100 [soil metagenome]